jgi:hypothetical protein
MGRLKKYRNVELLQEAIDRYFKRCDDNRCPYTIMGLANSLDIDRQTLLNYQRNDEYFDTVRRAKNKVEESLEVKLLSDGRVATGTIFNLKNNFGWRDRQEVTQEVTGETTVNNKVSFSHLSVDELKKLLDDE